MIFMAKYKICKKCEIHHFENCGWRESKVVARFWILAVIFAILGLATLKIR